MYNLQKHRDLTPLSLWRGAVGEVNETRPEKSLQLDIFDLYPPTPFSPGERGVKFCWVKRISIPMLNFI
jgi:hypothetical protein